MNKCVSNHGSTTQKGIPAIIILDSEIYIAILLAMLSSLGLGIALITGRVGLRTLDARAGAAISIPTATAIFLLAVPLALDAEGFTVRAALLFVLVGLFFPATVTLLTFRSNELLGPTITGAVSGTAPLFALVAAGLLLGEKVPSQAALSCVAIAVGIALLSWKQDSLRPGYVGWSLLWPVSGAMVRGLAQACVKAGLILWPNPFAAGLIGYMVSSSTVISVNRFFRVQRPPTRKHGVVWFAVTGVLNGAAVLLMYAALSMAPVSLVAPIVATYPLITALVSAMVLREEPMTRHMLAGAATIVLAIVYLLRAKAGV